MGGKLFKNSIPVDDRTYKSLVIDLTDRLEKTGEFRVLPTLSCRSKKRFNDIDLFILDTNHYGEIDVHIALINDIKKRLGLTSEDVKVHSFCTKHQWAVFSFLYKNTQVDCTLLHRTSEFFNLRTIMGYGIVGSLIGRIYARLGMRLAPEGLFYRARSLKLSNGFSFDQDHLMNRESYVSFRIIGLDETEFLRGFNTLEDAFAFVVKSPFFCSNLFTDKTYSTKYDKKFGDRDDYKAFLEYLKLPAGPVHPGKTIAEATHSDLVIFPLDKVEEIIGEYSGLYLPMPTDVLKDRYRSSVFSKAIWRLTRPDLVVKATGLKFSRVSEFCSYFEEYLCEEVISSYVAEEVQKYAESKTDDQITKMMSDFFFDRHYDRCIASTRLNDEDFEEEATEAPFEEPDIGGVPETEEEEPELQHTWVEDPRQPEDEW